MAPPVGGTTPFFGAPVQQMMGETRKLRYDNAKDSMGTVLFPSQVPRAVPQVDPTHRNVTSRQHPFLGDDGQPPPPAASGRRAVRGPPSTADLLHGPDEDAPTQKLVGVSTLRGRPTAADPSNPLPSAGRSTKRENAMGEVLFGGDAPVTATQATGRRRGPVDYSEYQLKAPPSSNAQAPTRERAKWVLQQPTKGTPFATHEALPSSTQEPDALDEHMREGHMRTVHGALQREIAALPRAEDGTIANLADVANALRKQVCAACTPLSPCSSHTHLAPLPP